MTLEGRVALVTGASQGIGHACALQLARHGAKVAVAARNQQKLDELVAQIAASGGAAAAFAMDVADEDQVKSAIKSAIERFGKVDILVNNAGITKDKLMIRMKEEEFELVLDINLKGAWLATQAAARPMMKQRWGRVINIASVVGQMGNAGQSNYVASKAAHRPHQDRGPGIRQPQRHLQRRGPRLHRHRHDRRLRGGQAECREADPPGPHGHPYDIANAVCFLASDEAAT